MPEPRATSWAAVLLSAGAIALTGCDGEPDPVSVPSGEVRVELSEYRIEPQVVQVPSGEVTLVAHNTGRLTHNLKVRSLDRERGQAQEVFGEVEDTMFPGESSSGTFTLGPGKYELVCTIGNHDDLGQTGTLIVGDGSEP